MKPEIEKFVDNLQELIDSKKLLDKILSCYMIYDAEFDNGMLPPDLNDEIRKYIKFDDSE